MDFSEQIHELALHINSIIRQAATKHSISFAQAQLLLKMPIDRISISELSKHLGIDISTMSRNINKLEKVDILERVKSVNDKRTSEVLLTNKGKKIVTLLYSELDSVSTKILSLMPMDTQQNMADILEQLNWSFIKYRDKQ